MIQDGLSHKPFKASNGRCDAPKEFSTERERGADTRANQATCCNQQLDRRSPWTEDPGLDFEVQTLQDTGRPALRVQEGNFPLLGLVCFENKHATHAQAFPSGCCMTVLT